MADAVAGIGAEYGAVINQGDVIDVLSLAGQGEVPYTKLIDRMDRAQVMLWRGGDLSTMSRANGVGSNPQQESADELDADNAEWVSETLNRSLTKRVIAWRFGKNAPVLCGIKLRTKQLDNLVQDLATVQAAQVLGVRISKAWFTGKFGIVVADADEAALGENVKPKEDAVLKRQISYATWKREQETAGKQTHTPPPEVAAPKKAETSALNYSPSQPRDPMGVSTGGRWVAATMTEGNASEQPKKHSQITDENSTISHAEKGIRATTRPHIEGYGETPEGPAGQAAADVLGAVARADSGRHPNRLTWPELGLLPGLPGRMQKEQAALADLAVSRPDLVIKENDARQFAKGGEHVIELNAQGTRVIKHAHEYGFTLFADQPDVHNLDHRALNIRRSTPGEYLERMQLQNQVFGDDIRLEGLSSDGRPVISQGVIKGRDATFPEIDKFMKGAGFVKISPDKQALTGILNDTGWFHPAERIVVADLRPANVKVDHASGELIPIDVMITRMDQDLSSLLAPSTNAINTRLPDAPDAAMQALRTALAADLQPLGDALLAAYQAGDHAATLAALKKISKDMPALAGDAANLTRTLAAQFATAWLGE